MHPHTTNELLLSKSRRGKGPAVGYGQVWCLPRVLLDSAVTACCVSTGGRSEHPREKNRGRRVCLLAEIKAIFSQNVSRGEQEDCLVSPHIAMHRLDIATRGRVP